MIASRCLLQRVDVDVRFYPPRPFFPATLHIAGCAEAGRPELSTFLLVFLETCGYVIPVYMSGVSCLRG